MKLQRLMNRGIALPVLALMIAPAASQDAGQKEQAKLMGVWKGWLERPRMHIELTITQDKIIAKNLEGNGSSLGEGTYKLDPKTKTLDGIQTAGSNKGKTYLGIYSLEGDTLKWCTNHGEPQAVRPNELKSRTGRTFAEYWYLITFQREKK